MFKNVVMFLLSLCINGLSQNDLQFKTQLQRAAKQKNLQFMQQAIATTFMNNSIQLYAVTANLNKTALSQFQNYPAILLTALMHPREDTSFHFLRAAVFDIVNKSESDPQMSYLLKRAIVLIVPFLNIDTIKFVLSMDREYREKYRKNMNYESTPCHNGWSRGVDINRNFDFKYGAYSTSEDPCGQQFRGKFAFSEIESQAVKSIFETFHVIMALDIHSYGNLWIYPYASESSLNLFEQHALFPQYNQIFQWFTKLNIKYDNCYHSLQYLADGVYIDWALSRGAVSFAIQFGDDFTKDGSQTQIQLSALEAALRINSNAFTIFKSLEDKRICVKSTSTLSHNISIGFDTILQSNGSQFYILPNQIVCISPQTYLRSNHNFILQVQDSKIKKSVAIAQIQAMDISGKVTQLDHMKALDYLKIGILIVSVLCLISSLCGLSIFCEKAIGVQVREQEIVELSYEQVQQQHSVEVVKQSQ